MIFTCCAKVMARGGAVQPARAHHSSVKARLMQISDYVEITAQLSTEANEPRKKWNTIMTVFSRTTLSLAGAVFWTFCGAGTALANSTITVSLWDRGADSVMMDDQHNFGMSKGMMGGDMPMAMMGIGLSEASVPAGMITFNVTNDSKDIIHEMVVTAITSTEDVLPYLADEFKIDEDAAGHLGEVAELDPGAAGSLGLDMKPGLYLLYCNIPGHYIGGMWTVLTVTE
mgnify:CR=1 FL=1